MRGRRGFTLMEAAAAIAVLGLLAAPVLHYMHLAKRQEQIDVTRANLAAIQTALQKFQNNNGYYPCPALLNVAAGTASFGKAAASPCAAVPPGLISLPQGDNGGSPVVMGAVPGRDLGLSDETMLDGWDDLIVYAVTTNLAADSVTYKQNMNSTAGINKSGVTIQVFDPAAFTLTNAPAVPFALISLGADGRGAYRASGVAAQACTIGTLDYKNCAPLKANFVYAPLGRSAISTTGQCTSALLSQGCHYDDMVAYPGNGGVCPPGQTIVKVDVAHLLASYNMTGLSYECQTVPVTADTTATADPPDSATPSRSGTSAAAPGIDTMDTLTCPPGRLFAGIRENGTPYCVAHQIQNGVIAQGTNGTPCNAAYLGQLATDASGNLLMCDDDAPASAIAAGGADCTGFNAGAMTFTPSGDIFICNGGAAPPPPPPSLVACGTVKHVTTSPYNYTVPAGQQLQITSYKIGGGGGGGAGGPSTYFFSGANGGAGSGSVLKINGTTVDTATGGAGGDSGVTNGYHGQARSGGPLAVLSAGNTIDITLGEGGGGGGGGADGGVRGGGGGGGAGYGHGGNGGQGAIYFPSSGFTVGGTGGTGTGAGGSQNGGGGGANGGNGGFNSGGNGIGGTTDASGMGWGGALGIPAPATNPYLAGGGGGGGRGEAYITYSSTMSCPAPGI